MTDSNNQATVGCLARIFWMFAGNIVLVLSANFVRERQGGFLSVADLVFWAVVACLMAVRYIDIKRLNGLTATGQPASPTTWRRYAAILFVVSLALWGVAHALRHVA